MEKELCTPLDKYLEDSISLQNCYQELKDQLKNEGFLQSLAQVLVSGESNSVKPKSI